jgi:hypothetical protein
MEEPITEHYQEKGETVISEGYCVLLSDEMKSAQLTKRIGRVSANAVLQHNNVRPHAANKTVETIQDLKVELQGQHPYSLNLSLNLMPSDFYIFGTLDVAIRRVHASDDEEVNNPVHS